jgi:hypothetical protein
MVGVVGLGTPAGVRKGAGAVVRWCRACLAQPPATSCDAFGIEEAGEVCALWLIGSEF